MIAGGGDAYGAVVLLRAVNAIGKIVVRGDVIKLRGWLIHLRGPIFAAIHGNGGAAIVAVDHAIGIIGIDPQTVMVAVRSGDAFERFASIDGTIQPGVGDIDFVGIFRVGPQVREIPGALPEAMIFIDKRPVFAAVAAAIQAALFRFDQRVNNIRIFAGYAHADAAQRALGHAVAFDALPGAAIVIRTVQAVFVAAAVEHPRSAIAFPHRGEKHVRVVRIENDVDAAGAIIEI